MHCWPLTMLPSEMPAGTLANIIGRLDYLLEVEQKRRASQEVVNV